MDRSDFELGETIDVGTRPRAGVVVSARLTADEADALMDLAEREGMSLSQIAREALLRSVQAGDMLPTSGG
jgi:hypothetical protein